MIVAQIIDSVLNPPASVCPRDALMHVACLLNSPSSTQ